MTNNTDPVRALLREYRPTMNADVLHAWAKDMVAALAQQPAAAAAANAERAFFAQDFYEEAREGKKPWPAAPSGEAVGTDGRRARLLERRNVLNNSFGNGAYQDGRVQQQIDAIDAELAALAAPQQPAAAQSAAAPSGCPEP
ncbi:CheA signal transduction histidine kinase (STHK) [Pseudoxanthomonas suwonensis 11-1]|uniref:CheA signal transduction histidine kinase (STHK) n=1 Tax=Pseudoxanthomonas suwonensis (strain 11-1) TaxID=743721 RepID=E6WS28_PSEUU|nr:hypothetical protein [Pseudoxanthomonas suwonensis]ADV26977.1 CheA signal transduction histidine kinase (STHK) [Pseudoxanthomonas suwonensis 11-1]